MAAPGPSALSGLLTKLAQAAFGLGVASQVAQSAVYIVDGGHRAVVFDRARGVLDAISGEGMNFVIPWWQVRARSLSLLARMRACKREKARPHACALARAFRVTHRCAR